MHVECVCVCVVIQSCWYDSQGDTCSVVHAAKRHNNVRLFWAVLLCTVPFFFVCHVCRTLHSLSLLLLFFAPHHWWL